MSCLQINYNNLLPSAEFTGDMGAKPHMNLSDSKILVNNKFNNAKFEQTKKISARFARSIVW